jgi:hypothetical protein
VNKKFARVEQIKKFFLLDTQLTAEDEELTPTMKLKRKLVEKKYAEQIEPCTAEPNDPQALFTTKGDLTMKLHPPETPDRTEGDARHCRWPWPAGPLRSAQQGVSKNEIVLGSIQDLSGPLAGFGKQARNGMQLRVDEINEQGGIHGRKLKLLKVEDSGYDPKKAVLAAQKLVNQDKIFMMVGHIGTAQNNGGHAGAVREERHQLLPDHRRARDVRALPQAQVLVCRHLLRPDAPGAPKLVKEKGAKKVCTIYQDDDFGLEVLRGAEAGLKTIGMDLAEKTSFKRGATDFSSQVAKHEGRGCDWWCWAPSSARPSAPSAKRARPASTRSSWAPARPTPT